MNYTPAQAQQLLSKLYDQRNHLEAQVEEAKQDAVYAESLGVDLGREADHVVFVYEERLAHTLTLIDVVRWVLGYGAKHRQEFHQIMDVHYKEVAP